MKSVNDFSLSEFVHKNKSKIDKMTPKNPPISKDDEWRKPEPWDNKPFKKDVF